MSAFPLDLKNIISTANTSNLSIIQLISSADLISKLIMLILIAASIYSWGIVINKVKTFSKVKVKMTEFEEWFWSGKVLDELYEKAKKSIDNPLSSVFVSAFNECKKYKDTNLVRSESLKTGYKERLLQIMYLAKNREMESLEYRLSFLATTGSSSPFFGLFGTVLGIINSFQSIALSKSTNLAIVAPGIAEALIVTAIGLFVAIPAIIFYNSLMLSLDGIQNRVDHFIGELNLLFTRAIDEEKM